MLKRGDFSLLGSLASQQSFFQVTHHKNGCLNGQWLRIRRGTDRESLSAEDHAPSLEQGTIPHYRFSHQKARKVHQTCYSTNPDETLPRCGKIFFTHGLQPIKTLCSPHLSWYQCLTGKASPMGSICSLIFHKNMILLELCFPPLFYADLS